MASPIEIECEAKFGIDFEKQVQQILPYFWSFTIGTQVEKTVFLNYVFTLFSGLKPVNVSMVDFCSFINTRLSFTGQVIALIQLLNDNFDNTLRRITLDCLNNNFVEGLDIFLDSETDSTPIILFLDSELNPIPISVFLDSEILDPTSIAGKSFVVNVPTDVVESDEIIRALLDIYVIAPQEYLIVRF